MTFLRQKLSQHISHHACDIVAELSVECDMFTDLTSVCTIEQS